MKNTTLLRRTALLLALAMTALLLPGAVMAEERTKVQVMSWWDITKSEPLKQLEAAFEAENPDIDLEFPMIGSKYGDKIITVIAGGGDSVPDVIMLAMDLVPKFALTGAIQPLDGYMTEAYKASLYPLALNALTVDGSVYAAARDVSPMAMFLNVKLFEEAGIELPNEDWTVEDFLEIAQKLTKADASGKAEQWGYYFPKYPDTMYDWVIMEGGRYVSEDGKKSLMSTPETKAGLQFMYDLIYKYGVCPTEAQHSQYGDGNFASFLAGKVGMQIAALSFSSNLTSATPPIEYAVVPLPKKDGMQFTHAFVNTWAIPRGAKNPELSWRVIEWLSGKGGQQIALDFGMGLPASKEVNTAAFVAQRADNQVFLDALNYAAPFETYQYGAEFNVELREQLDALWLNETTVDDAAAAIDAAAEFILAGDK